MLVVGYRKLRERPTVPPPSPQHPSRNSVNIVNPLVCAIPPFYPATTQTPAVLVPNTSQTRLQRPFAYRALLVCVCGAIRFSVSVLVRDGAAGMAPSSLPCGYW